MRSIIIAAIVLCAGCGTLSPLTLEGQWEGRSDCESSSNGVTYEDALELEIEHLGDGLHEAEYVREVTISADGIWYVIVYEGVLEIDLDLREGPRQDVDVEDDCEGYDLEENVYGERRSDAGPCPDTDFEGEWVEEDVLELVHELDDGGDCVFELER